MSETTIEHEHEPVGEPVGAATSDEQLIAMLVDRARSEGLQLTGVGGLLQQLTKRVLESALEGEITDHLGYTSTISRAVSAATAATALGRRSC